MLNKKFEFFANIMNWDSYLKTRLPGFSWELSEVLAALPPLLSWHLLAGAEHCWYPLSSSPQASPPCCLPNADVEYHYPFQFSLHLCHRFSSSQDGGEFLNLGPFLYETGSQQTVFLKDHIFWLQGHEFSIAPYSTKAAIDNIYTNDCGHVLI